MSVTKTITLTKKGNAAGPYYEVSCSNDCVTYGACITTGSIYLPTIGSIANVNIYDTTTCIKLVNHNTDCNNSVIHSFAASGSTTTTSTTSTTTTTAAPTYRFYNLNINSGSYIGTGNSIGYTDQFNNVRTLNLVSFGNRFYMYAKSGSFNFTNVGATYILTDLGPSTTSTLSYHIYAGTGQTRLLNYQAANGEVVQYGSSNPEDYYVCAISGAIRQGWPQVTFPYTITQEGSACATTTTTTTAASGIRAGTSYTQVCSGGGSSVSTITYIGGTTICNASTISALTFNSMSAGTYWMYEPTLGYVEYYKSGGFGTDSMDRVGVGCTACSTSTTTTAAPILYYYNVTQYNCFPCSVNTLNLLASSTALLTNGYYYNNGDGYVYLVNYGTSPGVPDVDLTLVASGGTDCNGTCSI
jgi:hypothetical protein